MRTNNWNTALYEGKHGYVWHYGRDLLELLSPQPGEQILDLGCGTGQLTAAVVQAGATVMGIDSAPNMIEKARQNYSHLHFNVADDRDFQVDRPLDAVFSNAVLHWIPEVDAVIRCVSRALKSGGRFVAEFGGQGNVQAITRALEVALEEFSWLDSQLINSWYFPSIGEYASQLEQQGFEVVYATLFARPTPLEGRESGMADWLRMFGNRFLQRLSESEQLQAIRSVENQLRPSLYRDGTWIADHRRIRVIALKW
ncbi:MAG: methyltransferase domain-containing protein [Hydrococcus sp. C42_A2020_068]|nr:methyltransferase domain-containing protein [Hydrococcus sp. C42_A2020_068]